MIYILDGVIACFHWSKLGDSVIAYNYTRY
jgi:hypothetical protein